MIPRLNSKHSVWKTSRALQVGFYKLKVCLTCSIQYVGTNVDEVRLLEEIGRGSFGVVHRAVWRGTIVAAKVLPGGQAGLTKAVAREITAYKLVWKN